MTVRSEIATRISEMSALSDGGVRYLQSRCNALRACNLCPARVSPMREIFYHLGMKITGEESRSHPARCTRHARSAQLLGVGIHHSPLTYICGLSRAIAFGCFVDNETGSLKSRESFAHASITSCVHGSGKKGGRENLSGRSRPPAT